MLQSNVKKTRSIFFSGTSALCQNILNICFAKKVRDQRNSLAFDYNLKTERLNNSTRSSYVTVELIIQSLYELRSTDKHLYL